MKFDERLINLMNEVFVSYIWRYVLTLTKMQLEQHKGVVFVSYIRRYVLTTPVRLNGEGFEDVVFVSYIRRYVLTKKILKKPLLQIH